jgi:hypothetical protein
MIHFPIHHKEFFKFVLSFENFVENSYLQCKWHNWPLAGFASLVRGNGTRRSMPAGIESGT